MPSTQVVPVSSTVRYEATGSDQQSVVVTNLGPDLCYYAVASTVSSGSNDGSLAAGAQLAFTPSKFFISAGSSRLQVVTVDQWRQYDRDNGQAGILAPGGAWFSNTRLLLANTAYVMRFVPSRPMTIISISYVVTTFATNDDAVDVGLYNSALGLITSKGATTGQLNTAAGTKVLTIPATTLVPGRVHYAALSCGAVGGTAATLMASSFGQTGASILFGTADGILEAGSKTTSHPLPASLAAPTTNAITSFPTLVLRET